MKHSNNIKFIFFLLFTVFLISCAQKEVPTPSENAEAPQADIAQEEPTVLEQITTINSEDEPTEQQTKKEEVTARTYPAPETIKKYEPAKKDDTWFLVGGVTGDRPYSVFVDPETIENKDGLVHSWSRLRFEDTQRDEDGLGYQEVQIASDVDCENRTYSYTDSKFYDALGRLVESQRTPYEPAPIVDGTVSAQIADFVCGYDLNSSK